MRNLLFLSLFALTLESCSHVTIPNTEACTSAGTQADGAICAETQTDKTRDMTLDAWIDFLEPQDERPDPSHPGQMLPARAGAICQSADDYSRLKTAMEQACRALGNQCTPEIQQAIRSMERIERLVKRVELN